MFRVHAVSTEHYQKRLIKTTKNWEELGGPALTQHNKSETRTLVYFAKSVLR